jgi:hypothetical protein
VVNSRERALIYGELKFVFGMQFDLQFGSVEQSSQHAEEIKDKTVAGSSKLLAFSIIIILCF